MLDDIPGKTILDKYGNSIKLCEKCEVPVLLDGAIITCKNGCYIGEINWRPRNQKATEENDYNPTVTKMCSECRLEGRIYFQEDGCWCVKECSKCDGVGSIEEKMYSDCDTTVMLEVNEKARTKCPKCHFTFFINDPNVWLGDRHRRCGQKLEVPKDWLLYWPAKS